MPKAWDAINAAGQGLIILGQTSDVRVIEEAWDRILTNLDIAWNQAGAALKDLDQADPVKGWFGNQGGVRGSDELLVYMDAARNNRTHNSAPIVSRQPSSQTIIINPQTRGGAVHVTRIAPGLDGSPFGPGGTFDVAAGVTTIIQTPASIKPLPAVNRGKTYPIPKTHLGKDLQGQEFVHLAAPAVLWHWKLLHELETRLNSGTQPQWMVWAEQFARAAQANARRIMAEQAAKAQKKPEGEG